MGRMLGWAGVGVLTALMGCVPIGLKEDYAAYNNCDVKDVKAKQTDGGWQASGCGRPTTYMCRSAGGPCESPRIVISRRHAQQFGCEEQDVAVSKLAGGAWEAEGCGQTMTYQCLMANSYEDPDEPTLRCIAETAVE